MAQDQIDQLVQSMPIWPQGYSHIVKDLEWTLLRPSENWAQQLEGLAAGGWERFGAFPLVVMLPLRPRDSAFSCGQQRRHRPLSHPG